MWTGDTEKSRKAPIVWKTICIPKSHGGLNMINMNVWNMTKLTRLLWNLNGNSDNLWVKWVHAYYLKNHQLMDARVHDNFFLDYERHNETKR